MPLSYTKNQYSVSLSTLLVILELNKNDFLKLLIWIVLVVSYRNSAENENKVYLSCGVVKLENIKNRTWKEQDNRTWKELVDL